MVWNIFYFPIYWVSNNPNWLSYFSEGWPNHQPVIITSCFATNYARIPAVVHTAGVDQSWSDCPWMGTRFRPRAVAWLMENLDGFVKWYWWNNPQKGNCFDGNKICGTSINGIWESPNQLMTNHRIWGITLYSENRDRIAEVLNIVGVRWPVEQLMRRRG